MKASIKEIIKIRIETNEIEIGQKEKIYVSTKFKADN